MSIFLKNVFQVLSGNIAAQMITLGSMPLITRMYSPADFGVFSAIVSIIAVLLPVSNLRYNAAIPLPEETADAFNLLLLSFLSAGLTAAVLAGMIGLWEAGLPLVPETLVPVEAREYLWAVPIGVFLGAGLLNLNAWAVRYKLFKALAVSDILEAAVNRGFVLIGGWAAPMGGWGLIMGRLFGMAMGLIYLVYAGFQGVWRRFGRMGSLSDIRNLAYRYRDFPIYSTWSGLVFIAAMELPVVFLLILFSPEVSGYFALGVRIVRFPVNMVGNALSRVFFQKAAALKEKETELAADISDMIAYMTFTGLPAMLILIFFGDWIFGLVFGEQWTESGVYVQMLTPSYLFIFLFRPLVLLFTTMERQKALLLFSLLLLLVRAAPLWAAAILFGSAHSAILGMSAATCLVLLAAMVYLFRLLSLGPGGIVRPFFLKSAAWMPLAIGLAVLRLTGVETISGWIGLVASVMIQMVVIARTEPVLIGKGLAWLHGRGGRSHA